MQSAPPLEATEDLRRAREAARAGRSILLTGRAGTGKSTLLRQLLRDFEAQDLAARVVAPTGVAALNVDGETIHRHFGFGHSLLPDLRGYEPPSHLAEVEVLIVDEVSMVRADLFDMMSRALSRARRDRDPSGGARGDRGVPFGGAQVLLIGDLYQLPPVVTAEDQPLLAGYPTPYFFSAQAFAEVDWLRIELTRIFRQRDARFIALLEQIRQGDPRRLGEALSTLNRRVVPGYVPPDEPPVLLLTPTNRLADEENRRRLRALGAPVHRWRARSQGGLSPGEAGIEAEVEFAEGAQIMMSANSDRFVNGTLGRITRISQGPEGDPRVTVQIQGQGRRIVVGPHRWEVWRTVREQGRLSRSFVGSVEQMPFRLAWAVTIHRSQGQTFDRVIVDRGRGMFESGQLYVALSRCRSLEGLVLVRPLQPRDVRTDPALRRFLQGQAEGQGAPPTAPAAYVGWVETGGRDHGRLAEIAVLRTPSGDPDDLEAIRFDTLVHPLRDLSEAAEAGITGQDVGLAPTLEAVRPLLAALLDGATVLTERPGRLAGLLGWRAGEVDEGTWSDPAQAQPQARPGGGPPGLGAAARCERLARDTWGAGAGPPRGWPLGRLDLPLRPGLTLLSRDPGWGLAWLDPARLALAPREREILSLALGFACPSPSRPGAGGEGGAASGGIRRPDRALAEAALAALVEAAGRGGPPTAPDRARIEAFARQVGLAPPPSAPARPAQAGPGPLAPGMRVCLTGEPPRPFEEPHLTQDALQALLARRGLALAPRVTRAGCDLVVAYDPRSLSVKARTARAYGKPLISSAELHRLLTDEEG